MYLSYFLLETLSVIIQKDDSFILMILYFSSIPSKAHLIKLTSITLTLTLMIHIIQVHVFSSHEP